MTLDKLFSLDSVVKSLFATVVCAKNSGNIARAAAWTSLIRDSVFVKDVSECKLLQLEVEVEVDIEVDIELELE